jgi:hypothetical protein
VVARYLSVEKGQRNERGGRTYRVGQGATVVAVTFLLAMIYGTRPI